MDEFNRKKQDLLNKNKFNQIKVGWMSKIDILHEMVDSCSLIEDKKRNVFFKVSNSIE